MGRFETATVALPEHWSELAGPSRHLIDHFHVRNGLKYIGPDKDGYVCPTHCAQEGTAWNGPFDCSRHDPQILFNQFRMLERWSLRRGGVHSADDQQGRFVRQAEDRCCLSRMMLGRGLIFPPAADLAEVNTERGENT
jgi:hypothetical protein